MAGADEAEAKAWLAAALKSSGHTKASLHRDTGVGTRTITTIFAPGEGLGNGVNLYKVMRALELLKDPPGESETTAARLDVIDAKLGLLLSPEQREDVERAVSVLRRNRSRNDQHDGRDGRSSLEGR